MHADKEKIEWLLFKSKKTIYSIAKESGVPQTTVRDLANKKTKIENMTLKNAAKLTEYANKF